MQGLRGKKKDDLRKICNYLERNVERMRYDEYLAKGYPIASGVIEGGVPALHQGPNGAQRDALEHRGGAGDARRAQRVPQRRLARLSGLLHPPRDRTPLPSPRLFAIR